MNHSVSLSMKCIPPRIVLYSKTRVYRGIPILFLIQNMHCGYSLEPSRRGGSNVYPHSYVMSMNIKIFFLMEYSIVTYENNLCILHGQVFVM